MRTRIMRGLACTATIVVMLIGRGASAQQQVYDPLPPSGSAYVRFVNALGAELTLRPDFLPAQHLGTEPDQRVTTYFVVERVAGRNLSLDAQEGNRSGRSKLVVEAGSFVTVILAQAPSGGIDAIRVVDQADFNQTRARLSFYNATADCAAGALALDPDGPAVFQDVAPGAAKTRSVNPVDAQLRASCVGYPASSFALKGLEAGGMYSIWLMLPGGKPAAFVTRDTTARWRP
jgi:hypothetical protein